MPELLRDVLCVIETFHKYAREDGDKVTLTCGELKQLIQGEFGDILQPGVIHAVERNLNLLAIDSDGTISFDEFVLAIFKLLNLHYLDIQALLNSEPRQVSKPQEKPDDMDLQATSRANQWTERAPPTQDKAALHSELVSSAQLSPKERGHNKVDPQGNTKIHKLLAEASGHDNSENQHQEGDKQSQEVTQGVAATGDKRVQIETNKTTEGSEQASSPTKKEEKQNEKLLREEDETAREQSSTETRDQIGEQEGKLGTQSSASEETTQRPPEDQNITAEKGVKEHSNTQKQPKESSSELTDLPEQAAAKQVFQTQISTDPKHDDKTAETPELGNDADRTPPETKNSAEPEDNERPPETQEPSAQEHKTNNLPVQGDSRNVSETPDVKTENKEGRVSEAYETEWQEESVRKAKPPVLEDDAQGGKYQELPESPKEKDAEESYKKQELSSEQEYQNHPEIDGAVTSGEEAIHSQERATEAFVGSKNTPAAEGTPEAREIIWELSPLENQSGGKNKRVSKTHDKSIKEDDGYQGKDPEPTVTQNDKEFSETPTSLAPEDGDISSGTSDLLLQEDCQSQVDSLRESVQESHNSNPDNQKQVAMDKKNRTQEAVAIECELLSEEQEDTEGEEHKIQGSATKGPGPAVESNGQPKAQTHHETAKLATLEKEDKSPHKSGKVDDQQNSAKKGHGSSILQSGFEERTQRKQELCSAEIGTAYSSPLYKYLQEQLLEHQILQQRDTTKGEHQIKLRHAGYLVQSSEMTRTAMRSQVVLSFSMTAKLYNSAPGTSICKDSAFTQQASALEDKQGHPQREEPEHKEREALQSNGSLSLSQKFQGTSIHLNMSHTSFLLITLNTHMYTFRCGIIIF